MNHIIQQLFHLYNILLPKRNMAIPIIAYFLATLLLLVGFAIGSWALYLLLLDYMEQTYALLSVSLVFLLLSLTAFLVGSKWRTSNNGLHQIGTSISNMIDHLQDNKTLQKMTKSISAKSAGFIIAGIWILSRFFVDHANSKD
jgi:uncharacterized membrane protein YccF (DUF307 family)